MLRHDEQQEYERDHDAGQNGELEQQHSSGRGGCEGRSDGNAWRNEDEEACELAHARRNAIAGCGLDALGCLEDEDVPDHRKGRHHGQHSGEDPQRQRVRAVDEQKAREREDRRGSAVGRDIEGGVEVDGIGPHHTRDGSEAGESGTNLRDERKRFSFHESLPPSGPPDPRGRAKRRSYGSEGTPGRSERAALPSSARAGLRERRTAWGRRSRAEPGDRQASSPDPSSLWMKPILTGTTQAIVARDNVWWPSPCAYYCVYIDELQSLVMKTGGTEAIITEDAIIEDEELYHLVISHLDTDGSDTGNAERSRIYLNGEMVGEMEEPEEIPSLDSIADGNGIFDLLWVGTMTSFGGFWGEMDDLQFYNGELTEEQVAELYANPGSAIGATVGLPGDFNGNGELDLDDINALTAQTASGANVADFDMNSDALVNRDDINVWLDEKNTWIGDSNLDGEFNSTDFVAVFTANEYEDAV